MQGVDCGVWPLPLRISRRRELLELGYGHQGPAAQIVHRACGQEKNKVSIRFPNPEQRGQGSIHPDPEFSFCPVLFCRDFSWIKMKHKGASRASFCAKLVRPALLRPPDSPALPTRPVC